MIISLPFIPSLQKNQYHMGNVVICKNLMQKASVVGSASGVANCFFSGGLFSLSPSNYFSLERQSRAVIKRWGPGISPGHFQRKMEGNRTKRNPNCLIPHLLFTILPGILKP